jgi:hypothetical protein
MGLARTDLRALAAQCDDVVGWRDEVRRQVDAHHV